MTSNSFGEIVFDEQDICDLIMQGRDVTAMPLTVDPSVNTEKIAHVLAEPDQLILWTFPHASDVSVPDYDAVQQQRWFMPPTYRTLDIAELVLGLCDSDAELQRCGQELMMYQERGLFDLLRYLKYLVDVMRDNRVIWGVGRGSSVASYVLYLLGVHRIDSLYYDLDPAEFLR